MSTRRQFVRDRRRLPQRKSGHQVPVDPVGRPGAAAADAGRQSSGGLAGGVAGDQQSVI